MRNDIPIKDYLRESHVANSRIIVAGVIVVVLVAALFLRLVWLQIFSHQHYATLSQANRINPVPIPPVRGLVLDRNGVVLAQNFPVFTLEVVPERVADMPALLKELGALVNLSERDLKNFERQRRERKSYEGIVLRTHLNEEEAARIALNKYRLDGVELEARLQRHYPLGGLAVHAVGYVGRISEQDEKKIDKTEYTGMQHIGKLGVEQTYERQLLGKVGFEQVETDAHGRAIRLLGRIPPVAGQNLYLHLDAKMQAIAQEALGRFKGAVVAMDLRSGGVVTFVSTPTYDPNLFVNGIDTETYRALNTDRNKPLINRALNGRYSPGSTIKPFMALAGLEAGTVGPNNTAFCPGWWSLPGSSHRFRCWKKEGHGTVDMHDAIVQSCDVYFYRLIVNMGIDKTKDLLSGFGFGSRTGIDLPLESNTVVPSPAWKQKLGVPWYPGDTVITGIGQGPILATPLQLMTLTGMVATRGTLFEPRLAHGLGDPVSKSVSYLPTTTRAAAKLRDPKHFDEIIADMIDVAHSPRGTAIGIGRAAEYKIAGKTGTAQVKGIAQNERYDERRVAEHFRDHALFIAFAPAEQPQIAVAVIVENGGHGSSAAAPVARKLMDYYLLGKLPEPPKAAAPARAPAPAATTNEEIGD